MSGLPSNWGRARLLAALLVLVAGRPASAQGADPCVEPDDPVFIDRMTGASQAIDDGDFEAALVHLEWARQHFDYVVLDFSTARAYHRLGRLEEARTAYREFLDAARECPDPSGLIDRAVAYLADVQIVLAADAEPSEQGSASETAITALPESEAEALVSSGAPAPDTETPAEPLVDSGPPPPDTASPTEPLADSGLPATDTDSSTELDTGQPPEPDRREKGFDAAWIAVGAGAALLVAGVSYDLVNMHLLDDQQEAHDETDVGGFARLSDDIDTARTVDFILYGSGLAVLGVGLTLLLIDDGGGESTPSVGAAVTGDGAVFTLDAAF
jgi:hypothetical protein